MSWFKMWNGLIKKTCRYMLQRYLGQFLEEKLNLDQLEVDLYSGKGTIKNVSLKIEALNEIFESQGWAVEVKGGVIGVLTVDVPWNSLMTSDSSIEISDLHITLSPKKRQSDGTSMLESMWSSVSSSMQLVEECMKQNDVFGETSDTSTCIGIEKFAETIDNVLNRIKAELKNTRITLEYLSPNGSKGIALTVNIDKLSYKNVTGCDRNLVVQPENDADNNTNANMGSNVSPKTVHLLPTFAKHKVVLNGLSMYSKEFIASNDFTKIPIMELKEQMEIVIKVKQSEEVNGPKVILNMELGTLYTFLSPRQVHLLTKICSAFVEEDTASGCVRKDMLDQQISSSNYHMNQTISQTNYMTGILGTNNTWNYDFNGSVSTNCTVENFCNASSPLNYNNYCESLTSSVTSNNTENSSSRFKKRNIKVDAFAEILTFNVQLSGLFFLVLHEDILVETNNYLNEDSQTDMISTATDFFLSLKKDQKQDPAAYSCKKNHIYLYMTPILCKGTQHRNKNILVSNCSITATKVDLCEVLESEILPIIVFDRNENCSEGYFKLPELIIDLKSTLSNITEESTTVYEVTLEKSILELDVTIYDRLSSIFGPSAFSNDAWVKNIKEKCTNDVIENKQGLITMSISSQALQLKIRFPINDARPIHDPERIPWWKQNIRDDFLLITFQSFYLLLKNDQVEISAQELSGDYCEKSLDCKKSILKAGPLNVQNELIVPKIVISTPSAAVLMKKINNFTQTGKLKLPYSSERVCRHSDTLHQKRNIIEEESNLLPGERDTINEFCEITQQISKLRICVCLPTADVVIESKNLYEVLYNRLNNDLLMWEPSSPILNRRGKEPDFPNVQSILQSINILSTLPHNPYADFEDKTFMSNDRNDESISESIYFSTHQENECRSKEAVGSVQPSETSFEIVINKGSLVLLVPVRDLEKHIVPEQSGKFHAQINHLKIFCVSGYASNRNLGYVCLQLNEMKVFHCGLTSSSCANNDAEYMQSTLYNMPKGITKGEVIGNEKRDTFSMVIEIKKQPNQRVKRLNITTGIQKLVLKHNLMPFPSIWLNQLMDFLDVPDYPIQGYSPFGVITEIQLHFWDCAIDYRPKNFPYRAVMEFGSLTIGSNLISTLNGCNLRFILEECVLSIAPFDYLRSGLPDHEITFIGSNNLVPVFDVGLCDISLWLKKSNNESCPNVDLRCSIHDAHLRTCYDSGSALAQLIAFITADGDLENDVGETALTSTQFGSDILSSTDSLVDANITDKQQERVNLLMAEAVQETVLSTTSYSQMKLNSSSLNDEIFYFPDECNKTNKHLETENEFSEILNFESNVMEKSYVSRHKSNYLPQVKADFGEAINITNRTEIHIQEEGYCVIADNEKKFMHNCGIQNITLPDDPIRIVDNHFCLPTENFDLLRAPADFPMATLRYTLCEMTFTWHIYGGKDFSKATTPNEEKKKHMEQSRMSEAYKHGVSYFKASKGVFNSKKPKEKLTWKSKGGPNRDYEVLVEIYLSKARFSHEVYPVNTSQASRQVLLVKEIEIRDRLQTSEINKFLCQPVLTNISNKSNQHMIVVKALHVRPHPEQSNTQECSLRISLLPIRLHIDQGTLEFLADFFSNISNYRDDKTSDSSKSVKSNKPNIGQEEHPPIMRVDDVPEAVKNLQARKLVTNNLDLLMENDKYSDAENTNSGHKSNESTLPIYFREVIFSPDVPICIDYHGRHVELSRGPIAGLLMGLGQLRCSEIRLQKLTNKRGILGFEKLIYYLCKEWLRDIKRNQLSKILSGVGPTHAFVQMFQGIYDLFWLPIEQYQKDGRIIKGLQLGAQSFSARTAIAALELTSRIIHLLQFTAETAFDMVSPGPSIKRHKKYRDGKKKRPYRPRDIREGVTNAYLIVKEGINDSANALIETAVAEHDQKGYSGAVGAVVRHIPQMVVCPAMLATQATTNILGGVRSSLVPEAKIEAQEKWKDSSN